MPFKSKSQQRYMFANMPKIAKEFAEETKSIKNLPEKIALSRVKTRAQRRANLKQYKKK